MFTMAQLARPTVKKQAKKQLLLLVSLVMFGSSTLLATLRLFSTGAPQTADPVAAESPTLADQARGYELVLQREPDNTVALEGLATARLQMQDAQAAIAPLEKLVKLNPDRADYAALLAQARQASQQAKPASSLP
ncbi:MAG: tetratricopeptide repeat protein [Synechococcales cyanobacterium M58_A2018_015]|nr:tetratricopeptide repeat protein [Synechococcales cyanobacterium M58_A2018_015]